MFNELMYFKSQEQLLEEIDRVDALQVTIPHDVDENGSSLRRFLTECSDVQDELLRTEKHVRRDIGFAKNFLRNKKSETKLEYNRKLVELKTDKDTTAPLKVAMAELHVQNLNEEVSTVESWLELLNQGMEFISNKKNEVKQKSYDIKLVYKSYLDTKPKSFNPDAYYGMERVNNPFHRAEPSVEEELV